MIKWDKLRSQIADYLTIMPWVVVIANGLATAEVIIPKHVSTFVLNTAFPLQIILFFVLEVCLASVFGKLMVKFYEHEENSWQSALIFILGLLSAYITLFNIEWVLGITLASSTNGMTDEPKGAIYASRAFLPLLGAAAYALHFIRYHVFTADAPLLEHYRKKERFQDLILKKKANELMANQALCFFIMYLLFIFE